MTRAADPLLPRPPGGTGPGVALSLVAHGLLFAALLWGVRWATPTAEQVSAELWAAVPQANPAPAAPPPPAEASPAPPPPPAPVVKPPPPAPPPPREADIAVEKSRQEKARELEERMRQDRERLERERQERVRLEKQRQEKEREDKARRDKEAREKTEKAEKAEKEAKARAEADKRQKAAADAQLAKQREENLARMMGQLGGSGQANTKAAAGPTAGPSASYAGRIVAAIKPNIVFGETITGNPAAEVEVRAGPSGTIIGRTLVKSSGRPDWDEAVLRAIDRTGTLPRDVDGRVPPRLTISFRPRD